MNGDNKQNAQNPENNKRRNNVLIAIGIVVLVVIIALAAGRKKTAAPTTDTAGVTDTTSTASGVDTGTQSTSSSYQDALEAYIGRSIQFSATNKTCTAFPVTQVFKVGSRALLDNHGSETVTVVFQDKTFTLRPYHYATVSLPTEGNYVFKCNGADVTTVMVRP